MILLNLIIHPQSSSLYTVAQDTLGEYRIHSRRFFVTDANQIDPNDFIYPRSGTRVGPRFQTNLLRMVDPNEPPSEPGIANPVIDVDPGLISLSVRISRYFCEG